MSTRYQLRICRRVLPYIPLQTARSIQRQVLTARTIMTSPIRSGNITQERTYENALAIINSRVRRKRPPPKQTTESSKPTASSNLRGVPAIVGMLEWLQMLGHTEDKLNSLNVIHIAGTKGKGSTCAFTESFLRTHGTHTGYPRKTGLYTSPHLVKPEERIRINGQPISRNLLATYFFEVYDKLPQLATSNDSSKTVVERGPRYLQLWALLAFHVFIREAVDVAVFETHAGGQYDATNVIPRPVVTAITTLGLDHIDMLGPTIRDIAWHKAGIYKTGASALSTIQDPECADVLTARAKDKFETINFVGEDPALSTHLNLEPSVQRKNASLAIAAANAFLLRNSSKLSKEDIRLGIENWSWPGRFQIISKGAQVWFLDSAHNNMSIALAARWFQTGSLKLQASNEKLSRIMIFSHINELRDAAALLRELASALKECDAQVEHVIFTTYNESDGQKESSEKAFASFRSIWSSILPATSVSNEPTITGAIGRAKGIGSQADKTHILITGSQHLVGPALRVLQTD